MTKYFIVVVLTLLSFVSVKAQDQCNYWFSRIDSNVKLQENFKSPDESNSQEIINGIECLLRLQGKMGWSRKFGIPLSNEVSNTFPPFPTIEVAALYYISTLYYQSPDSFTSAIALRRDGTEGTSDRKAVRKAFKYYRQWFEQVKKVGIEKARELNLEPLKDKDVRWY